MERLLFTVEDSFLVSWRGMVLVPGIGKGVNGARRDVAEIADRGCHQMQLSGAARNRRAGRAAFTSRAAIARLCHRVF